MKSQVLYVFVVILTVLPALFTAEKKTCPELECMEPCSYGFQRDGDGCVTCHCLDAECQGFKCADGKDCRAFDLTSALSKIPKCVDPSLPNACQQSMDSGPCLASLIYWFYDTDSDDCQEFTYGGCQGNHNRFTTKNQCEQKCITRCPSFSCTLKCEHGFKESKDGCNVCICRTEQAQSTANEVDPVPSVFKVLPGCEKEEEYQCYMNCPTGFRKDEDGCHVCHCNPPAHCTNSTLCSTVCPHGYREDKSGCPTCECRQKGECSLIECYMHCPNGRELDTLGCEQCKCKEDPCASIICGEGQECQLKNGLEPVCEGVVPQWLDGCPSVMCAMYCEHGFVSDHYGCNICKCRESKAPECPLKKCRACEPNFGYVYSELGCRTCTCHKDPCVDHQCDSYGTKVCVAEECDLASDCPSRPVCVSKADIRRILVHMQLHFQELPKSFRHEEFVKELRRYLSKLLNTSHDFFDTFNVSRPDSNSKTMDVKFQIMDDNGDPKELHSAVNTLKGAPQFEFHQTPFSSNPSAYRATYYTTARAPGTGEAKQGHTAYIIIGCVVGGLAALMMGVIVALLITKGRNKQKPASRRSNVVYKPTTYEENA